MKPEIGKWYFVEYEVGGDGDYNGKAKCLDSYVFDLENDLVGELWKFRLPNQPEDLCAGAYISLEEEEIIQETTPEPTYEELAGSLKKLQEAYEELDNSDIVNSHFWTICRSLFRH